MIEVLKNEKGSALVSVLGIALGLSIFVILIPVIWSSLDLPKVSLGDTFLSFFDMVKYIFYIAGYFIPIKFIISCLVLVFLLKRANLIFSIFNYIYNKVMGK